MSRIRTHAQFLAAHARWEEPPEDDNLTACDECDGTGHDSHGDDCEPCGGAGWCDENGDPVAPKYVRGELHEC
jgi:RecJ-like exonuclease